MTVHDPILAAAQRARATIPDDTAMLRAAAELTRDYSVANPRIYWPDMLGSALIGWAGMAGAIMAHNVAIAIVCEVIATSALKASESFTRIVPSITTVIGYAIAFYCLSLTLKQIPVGIAYAIWSGAGIVLIAAIGVVAFNQKLDGPAILGLGLIIAGVAVINLLSKTVGH